MLSWTCTHPHTHTHPHAHTLTHTYTHTHTNRSSGNCLPAKYTLPEHFFYYTRIFFITPLLILYTLRIYVSLGQLSPKTAQLVYNTMFPNERAAIIGRNYSLYCCGIVITFHYHILMYLCSYQREMQ